MPPPPTALARALRQVGDRWSLLLVEALMDGPKRFADLQEAVPGIATNVLSQRLRQLESGRIVVAVPYNRRPVRFSYELSDEGRSLAGAVRMLSLWSAGRRGEAAGAPIHTTCGSPLELKWWCPTCDLPAGADPEEAMWV